MEFLILWFIGVGLAVLTRIVLNKICNTYCYSWEEENDIYEKSIKVQIIMHILSALCIVLVGGIGVNLLLKLIYNVSTFTYVLIAGIFSIMSYVIVYMFLLKFFKRIVSQLFFGIVFVMLLICWIIVINKL